MTDEELAEAEEARVSERVADILADLRDCLKDCDPEERAGMVAAIEIIEANH